MEHIETGRAPLSEEEKDRRVYSLLKLHLQKKRSQQREALVTNQAELAKQCASARRELERKLAIALTRVQRHQKPEESTNV